MSVLENVQNIMKSSNIDFYIIPTSDYHQSEYVADYFKLRDFVSHFDGSAGTLVIEKDKAGLWTDSRYFLQAEDQLPESIKLHKMTNATDSTFIAYIEENIKQNSVIGFDAKCMSTNIGNHLLKIAEKTNSKIVLDALIADSFWENRPDIPKNEVYYLSDDITGEDTKSKIKFLADYMKEKKCAYTVISKLDDIAYLLNSRGTDVSFNPVFYSYFSLEFDKDFNSYKSVLYIDNDKLTDKYRDYLSQNLIELKNYNDIYKDIENVQNKTILIDKDALNFMLFTSIDDTNRIISTISPITMKKAVKNNTEIQKMIEFHKIDAVAMIKFLHYLKTNIGKEEMTEISVSDKLESFRRENEDFKDLSFDTIAGYKEHGAIVHYSATKQTDAKLENKSIILVDSGAQYLGATTDITRTIALGPVTDEEKHDFTTVLKAHLALSNAVFPENTTGSQLDALAKAPMWKENMNFFHGTGHGVGAFLNVHEGPHRISPVYNPIGFKRGMIVSNEPGFYKTNSHGIRIENLIYAEYESENEYGKFLKFVDLTLVPIDLDLVDKNLLSEIEIKQLNSYHQRVYNEISPMIQDSELKEFLKYQTRQI